MAPLSTPPPSVIPAFTASVLERGRGAYKTVSNIIAGQRFNSRAYDEAVGKGVQMERLEDDEWDDDENGEEWSAIRHLPRTHLLHLRPTPNTEEEPFLVQEPTLLSHATAHLNYLTFATRFLALEAARDIGYISSTLTPSQIIAKVKARFPVLEDLKRAFKEGGIVETNKGYLEKSDLWIRMREERERVYGVGVEGRGKAEVQVVPEVVGEREEDEEEFGVESLGEEGEESQRLASGKGGEGGENGREKTVEFTESVKLFLDEESAW